MAQVIKTNLTNKDLAISFFNNLNNPYISAYEENNNCTININDIFLIKNVLSNGIALFVNGTQVASISRYWSNPQIIIAYDDNFVYLFIQGVWSGSLQSNHFCVMYHNLNDLSLYGWNYSESSSSGAIENFTMTDENSQDLYKYNTIFRNYDNPIGFIDYTQKLLFENDIKTAITIPGFLDCSTVTEKQVITFNGKNYYAIGTHTLVQMDD